MGACASNPREPPAPDQGRHKRHEQNGSRETAPSGAQARDDRDRIAASAVEEMKSRVTLTDQEAFQRLQAVIKRTQGQPNSVVLDAVVAAFKDIGDFHLACADLETLQSNNSKTYTNVYEEVIEPNSFNLSRFATWNGREQVVYDQTVIRKDVFVDLFDGSKDPLPRCQVLRQRHPDLFVHLTTREQAQQTAFISHRWEEPGQPDPHATQLAQICRWIKHSPATVKYIWVDYWCLPQHAGDIRRTPEEDAEFKRGLRTIQWLCLEAVYVPLWGDDFLDRGWCYAELVWGYDRMHVVKGVNRLNGPEMDKLKREFGLFVAKSLLEGPQGARMHLASTMRTKKVTNQGDMDVVMNTILSFDMAAEEVYGDQLLYRGWFYKIEDQFDIALRCCLVSLVVRARRGDHSWISQSLNLVGHCLRNMGHMQLALPIHEIELELTMRDHGNRHPHVASCYESLATVFNHMGRHQKALGLHELCLDIRLSTLGSNHHMVAMTYGAMGQVVADMGGYAEALDLHERALAIFLKTLGEDHLEVASVYNSMADVLHRLGMLREALTMAEKGLDIRLAKLGQEHHLVAKTYGSIASLLRSMKQYQQALDLHEKELAIKLKTLGPDHAGVGLTIGNMATNLKALGRHQEAVDMHNQELEIKVNKLGENHHLVATAYWNMGALFKVMGDMDNARRHLRKAVNIFETCFGPGHPHTEGARRMLYMLPG